MKLIKSCVVTVSFINGLTSTWCLLSKSLNQMYTMCLLYHVFRKSSFWELTYTISIGGSEVDSRETTTLNTSLLTSNLNVTGPNKVKYRVITDTESGAFISARRVSSLYVTSFVSVEDVKKMEESIALAWKKQYNSMCVRNCKITIMILRIFIYKSLFIFDLIKKLVIGIFLHSSTCFLVFILDKKFLLLWLICTIGSEEVKVTFLRQKQYINSKG